MSRLPPCAVCGNSDYEIHEGFYVCKSCDIVSQDLRVDEFGVAGDVIEDREEIVVARNVTAFGSDDKGCYEKTLKERNLTSWEAFNCALKSIVEELIDLGVTEELRVVSFQVWSKYLQTIQAAFFSKQRDTLPVLGKCFKIEDAKILYGIDNMKDKILWEKFQLYVPHRNSYSRKSKKEDSSQVDIPTPRSIREKRALLNRRKKKMARLEIRQAEANTLENPSHPSLETIAPVQKEENVPLFHNLKFNDAMKDNLRQMRDLKGKYSKTCNLAKKEEIKRKIRRCMHKRETGASSVTTGRSITFSDVITIVMIALRILDEDVHFSHIFRWGNERRISLLNATTFVKNIYSPNRVHCMMRGSLHEHMATVLSLMHVNDKDLPVPNVLVLIRRFCTDLQLPQEFGECAGKLAKKLSPKLGHGVGVDYERRALVFILFTAKLLFSLDDETEQFQSLFAERRNRMNGDGRLFSWREWVQFVECRKAILAQCDRLADDISYLGRANLRESYAKKFTLDNDTARNESKFANVLKTLAKELPFEQNALDGDVTFAFPCSKTPNHTNTQYLLQNYPEFVPECAWDILKINHAVKSVGHVLNKNCGRDSGAVRKGLSIPGLQIPVFEEKKAMASDMHYSVEANLYSAIRLAHSSVLTPIELAITAAIEERNDEDIHVDVVLLEIWEPSHEYWFSHIHTNNGRSSELKELEKHGHYLPISFDWFLRECANLIWADIQYVYEELVALEKYIFSHPPIFD